MYKYEVVIDEGENLRLKSYLLVGHKCMYLLISPGYPHY